MAKSKTFTINEKTYFPVEFDFNAVCEFDKMGISLDSLGSTTFASARAYLALCSGRDEAYAGREIQEHVIKGGDLSDILNAFGESVKDSGFFQAITKRPETENEDGTETPKKEK